MPKSLKEFLEKLSDEDAEAIWTWVDEVYSHDTVHKIVQVISESHLELTTRICNGDKKEKVEVLES